MRSSSLAPSHISAGQIRAKRAKPRAPERPGPYRAQLGNLASAPIVQALQVRTIDF